MMNDPIANQLEESSVKTLLFLLRHEFQQSFIEWERRQPARNGLHVASLVEPDEIWCARKHVILAFTPEYRQEVPAYWSLLAKFVHGWAIHTKWQHDLLKHTGLVAWNTEQEKYELDLTHHDIDRDIHFSPDVILKFGNMLIPLEIKGINHDEYAGHPAYYSLSGELIKEEVHGIAGATLQEAMHRNKSVRGAVPQLNLYLHLLKLPLGIILVEDKNNQDFTLFTVEYSRELAAPAAQRASQVKAYVQVARKRDVLPARCCSSPTESRAKQCPVRDFCFKHE